MNDDCIDPTLAARLEEIMLAEDQGRLPRTPMPNIIMETVKVPPVSAKVLRQRSEHMRAITDKMKALSEQWFPSALMAHISWQWTSNLGQGCRVFIDGHLLYIEVRFDLSVIVLTRWPDPDDKLKIISDTKMFGPHDPVEAIVHYMRSMASRIMAYEARTSASRVHIDGGFGHIYGMSLITDGYRPEIEVNTKRLQRYYLKRKRAARARTGRRK